MSGPRELKIVGKADFSDIRTQSDAIVGKMNQIAEAAQRASRNVGLATDPMAFFAEAEAGKKSYSSVSNATGPKLVAQTTTEVERLAAAQLKVRDISRVLGVDGLGVEILRLRELVSLIGQLASIGPVAFAAAGGGLAGVLAAGYALYQGRETSRLNSGVFQSQVGNNTATLNKLREAVSQGRVSGSLRGGAADDIDQQILTLLRQNGTAAQSKSFAGGIIAAGVQSQLPDLIQKVKAALVASYKTEEEAARNHAQVLAEIAQTQFDTEKSQLRQKLELGVISNDRYAARLRGIAEEEAQNQRQMLDLQERQLKEHLDRSKADVEESAKTRNALQGVTDQRSLIDARLSAQQEQIEIDRVSRMSRRATGYRMPGDELSRIGLFVGGAGDSLPELSKAQLAELKQANAQLRNLPSQLGRAL